MARTARGWTLLLVVGLLVAAGCARSPEAKKARHLERGDRYFSGQQYREAVIEYRNLLQLEGTNARAIRQLGLAHYQLGELGNALRYLLKSQELEPDNTGVRLKLGTIYLLGRQPEKAREQAEFVLKKDPKSLEALGLLAGAANTPRDIDAAVRRLEEARADLGDKAKFHLALGTLYVRQRNVTGAEQAFKEAVAAEPTSVDAHTALGD